VLDGATTKMEVTVFWRGRGWQGPKGARPRVCSWPSIKVGRERLGRSGRVPSFDSVSGMLDSPAVVDAGRAASIEQRAIAA
jgi:hypothetical protein